MKKALALAALAAVVLTAAATAGVSALSGTVTADGSSTVGPYAIAAAEGFQKKNPKARVTVGISGTGGGFERFCRNEIDLSNASRPMRDAEAIKCRDAGVKWVAFTVANDGLSVVVNRQNTWANCLTVAELKKVWEPGSKVNNWNQIRDSFPNVPLEAVRRRHRLGHVRLLHRGDQRQRQGEPLRLPRDRGRQRRRPGRRGRARRDGLLRLLLLRGEQGQAEGGRDRPGQGAGCVTPSVATVQANKYRPLSRPLFIYAKRASFKRPVVAGYIGYIFNNEKAIAKKSGFIALTDRQLKKARYQYLQALKANNT